MAASVSRISRVVDLSTVVSTQATVAGADGTPPEGGFILAPGIDGSTGCNYFENGNNALIAGGWYSVWSLFDGGATIDMSVQGAAYIEHCRVSGTFNNINGIRVALRSGVGNWGVWEFAPVTTQDLQDFKPYRCEGSPDFTIGTFDAANVDGRALLARAANSDVFAFTLFIDQPIFVDGSILCEDTGTAAQVGFEDYYQLLKRDSSENIRSMLINKAGTTYALGCGVEIASDDYQDQSVTTTLFFESSEAVNYSPVADGFYRALFTPPASASQVFSGLVVAVGSESGSPQTCDLIVDASAASSSVSFSSSIFANVRNATFSGSGFLVSSTSLLSPTNVTIGAGQLAGFTISNSTNPIEWDSDLVSGSTFSTNSDINVNFDVGDYSDVAVEITANNSVLVDPTTNSGTYIFTSWTNSGFTTNFDIPTGNANDTTVQVAGAFTATRTEPTTGGGSITLAQPQDTLTITTGGVSALIQIFDFGTQTLLASTTGTSLAYVYSGTPSLEIRVQNVNYYPAYTAVSPVGTLTVPVSLTKNNVYQAGSPLTYSTDISYNRTTKRLTLNTAATVREQFSALIDAFYNESSLLNTDFDFQMNGTTSLFLVEGAEYASDTDAQRSTQGGIRYVNTSDVITAEWFGALSTSSIDVSTFQARYQLQIGTGTTNASNLGDIDQVIKVYGDSTHGNFDYRAISPRFKMQPNGYYQADTDLHSTYGISATEPVLYVFSLSPVAIPDFTAGDPGITGVSFTNNGATPITRESLSWGALISDTNNNSGENIQRWWNYNISLGGTFQGEDTFNLPDFIFGGPYQTNRGQIIGTAGSTQRGLWVERPSATPHPDFFQQQSDSGTFYVLPVSATASVSSIVAGSRIRIYNRTTATEIVNQVNAGTSYSASYTEGTDYSDGDVVDVFLTYQSGTDARIGQQLTTIASSSGWAVIASQQNDDVYILNSIDGSTITKFTADYVDNEIDIASASDFIAQEAYAWWVYNLTTELGIRNFFGGVTATDAANYRINTSVVSVYWDNLTTTNLKQTDSARIYRDDDVYPVKNGGATTGGGGVDINWKNVVYLATTGSGPLTALQEAQLASAASNSATAATSANLLVNDQGLNLSAPKVITEVTEGESYTESVDGVTKTIVKSGSTTTVTRTT